MWTSMHCSPSWIDLDGNQFDNIIKLLESYVHPTAHRREPDVEMRL